MSAFRLITRFGLGHIKGLKAQGQLEKPDPKWGVCQGSNSAYESLSFVNAFHHFGRGSDDHENGDDHLEEELTRFVIAVFFVKCLRLTDFFKEDNEEDNHTAAEKKESECQEDGLERNFTEDEILVGSLLAHFIWAIPANAHDVGELSVVAPGTVRGSQMTSLGGALFNGLSLFNHSCEPTFMRANVGNLVVCVAAKRIPKGCEVAENYGLNYGKDSTVKRHSVLAGHYGFKCACCACQGES